MLDTLAWRDRLALGNRSVTEIVTGLSIIAVLGSTLYNLGFFSPIEWSLISLLSVQDLLIGASVALIPMAVAAWQALWFAKLIERAPRRPVLACTIGLPAAVLLGAGATYFVAGPHQSVTGHLVCSYLLLGALAVLANAVLHSKLLPMAWLAFSLVAIPYSVGMATSLMELGGSEQMSEVISDQDPVRGKVLRVTSSYLLVFDGNAVVTLPMSKVKAVRRFFQSSPEADFLGS